MLKRTFLAGIILLAAAAPSHALNLTAQLFPLTGEVRLRNTSAAAVPFAYYSITSPSGALNGSSLVWNSISTTYDVSGNAFIDATNNWTQLSTVSTQLTEGVFSGPGGSLPAFRSVSLGLIWNPALYPSPDLTFDIRQPDSTPITTSTQFAVVGDYNFSGGVGPLDYQLWRQTFGSTTSLDADGNLNGVVDAADYVIWRENLGKTLPGSGSLVVGGGASLGLHLEGAVPEPSAILLVFSAGFAALTARGRARRAEPRGAHRS